MLDLFYCEFQITWGGLHLQLNIEQIFILLIIKKKSIKNMENQFQMYIFIFFWFSKH